MMRNGDHDRYCRRYTVDECFKQTRTIINVMTQLNKVKARPESDSIPIVYPCNSSMPTLNSGAPGFPNKETLNAVM